MTEFYTPNTKVIWDNIIYLLNFIIEMKNNKEETKAKEIIDIIEKDIKEDENENKN